MSRSVQSLPDYLAKLVDFRNPKGLRHPLAAILRLCCAALLSGALNPNAIAQWWENRRDQANVLMRLGFARSYGPSKSTLYRVLSQVSFESLTHQVSLWAEANLAHGTPLPADELEAVALDGKTLCGSQQRGGADTHLLSAVSHRLGVTLDQVAVNDKTNEIRAAPTLLAELVLEGRVFTIKLFINDRHSTLEKSRGRV